MIANGKEMTWNGHHLIFESEPAPCRGCFFTDQDSCPDCDEGIWVEKSHSSWHTGTPTEEGWYLIEMKDWEKQKVYYISDYVSVHDLVLPTVQSFYELHLWQKIEPSDEVEETNGSDN